MIILTVHLILYICMKCVWLSQKAVRVGCQNGADREKIKRFQRRAKQANLCFICDLQGMFPYQLTLPALLYGWQWKAHTILTEIIRLTPVTSYQVLLHSTFTPNTIFTSSNKSTGVQQMILILKISIPIGPNSSEPRWLIRPYPVKWTSKCYTACFSHFKLFTAIWFQFYSILDSESIYFCVV